MKNRKKAKDDFAALNTIGMSACYSPNPESEFGFDLPFDLETGEIRERHLGKMARTRSGSACRKICGKSEIAKTFIY